MGTHGGNGGQLYADKLTLFDFASPDVRLKYVSLPPLVAILFRVFFIMKPQSIFLAAFGLAAFCCTASAGARSSADYSISTESIDAGGATLASADYSVNTSINDAGSVVSAATSGYLAKSGFVGQLFDVVGVIPTAPSLGVNEGLTLQLGVAQVLDDGTRLPLSPSLAAWSVVGGPISSIQFNGLASAATVYQDTPATVRASCQGFTGSLTLDVLNVNTDDFGSYAADGLPDEWQTQYFGQNNPDAAPNKDATGSGQTNLFKYVAGLDPTDRNTVFRVTVQPVSGQPGQKQIVFGPVLPDRSYTVFYKTNLTDTTWTPLAGATQSDSDQERTVTDTNATGKAKFFRVQVSKP